MKITANVTKSSHQDHGLYYLYLQLSLVLVNSGWTEKFCSI